VPAAAVIPAPIAYVKVAAVKKLVVEDGLLRFQYNIIFFFFILYINYKEIKKKYIDKYCKTYMFFFICENNFLKNIYYFLKKFPYILL